MRGQRKFFKSPPACPPTFLDGQRKGAGEVGVPQLTAKNEDSPQFSTSPTPTPPPTAFDSRRRRGRCRGWLWSPIRLEVPPFLSAGQTFTGGIEAILPVWFAANLDEDVAAHEVGYGISKATPMIYNRGGVEVASACKAGQRFTFDQAVDNGLIPC